jgi:hypothetical protein
MTTREVTRDKLREVRSLDEIGFAKWLSIGFLEYAENQGSLKPFGEAWAFTGRLEDITDDVAAVHNVLLPAEQSLFREGVSRALAELDLGGKHGLVTARRLLQLAEKVSAITVLPILPTKIFCASWLTGTESGTELLASAADVAIDLAYRSEDSYATLQDLVASPAFQIQKSAARKALLALCKASPDDLLAHLQLLATYLHWMFVEREKETGRSLANERCSLFLQVAKLVRPRVLVQTIEAYNSENLDDSLSPKLSWWGEILTGRGVNSRHAAELKEIARKLQLLDAKAAAMPGADLHRPGEGWGVPLWEALSRLAAVGNLPEDQLRSQLQSRENWYGVSIDLIVAESLCRDSVDHDGAMQ